jgi:quinol monooxygenase YgiN
VIVVNVDVFAQIPQRAAAREAMEAAQSAAREEEGCIAFQFAETLEDPGHFVAIERWRDSAALDAHFRGPSFRSYQAAVTPLLVRDSEIHIYSAEELARPVDSSPLDLRQDD